MVTLLALAPLQGDVIDALESDICNVLWFFSNTAIIHGREVPYLLNLVQPTELFKIC